MKAIPLREPCGSLDGKVLVYRQDPIFRRKGWCLQAGSLIVEMQTMDWVNKLVTKRGTEGMTGKVVGRELVLDK